MEENSIKFKEKIEEIIKKAVSFKTEAEKITDVCHLIGKAWSGSSFVGHAKFFYEGFQEPTAMNRFSVEWGLINGIPDGWEEKSEEEIRGKIEKDSSTSLNKTKVLALELENEFQDVQREIILYLSKEGFSDISKIEKFTLKSATDYFNDLFPTKFMIRDTESTSGYYIAPHIYWEAVTKYILSIPSQLKNFTFAFEKEITKPKTNKSNTGGNAKESYYIENSIIVGLSQIKSEKYDLTKLIQMCKELNDNYSLSNYLACGMLIRSILDHIPPIFEKKTFTEVANNYGTKSFRDIILPLDVSSRRISDSYLHTPIRNKEILPNKTQVSFQPNMDTLLSEIIRVFKE
jgi:hypothetical protein